MYLLIMAFVGGVGTSTSSVRPRRRRYNPSEVHIILDRSVYFDGDALTGTLKFNTTSEHIYENACVVLVCLFRNKKGESFPVVSSRTSIATSDSGVLVVPENFEFSRTFRFLIPLHTPPSFQSKQVCYNLKPWLYIHT